LGQCIFAFAASHAGALLYDCQKSTESIFFFAHVLYSKTFKPQVKQRVYAQKEVSKDVTDSGLVASSSASFDMDTST